MIWLEMSVVAAPAFLAGAAAALCLHGRTSLLPSYRTRWLQANGVIDGLREENAKIRREMWASESRRQLEAARRSVSDRERKHRDVVWGPEDAA